MDNVFRSLRQKVSADKNRYKQGDFDLDLTYITPRIVAMAYPAEGVESTFRNNIEHVARMLRTNHPDRFMLYNLSNRPYDRTKFDDLVCAPSLYLALSLSRVLSTHERPRRRSRWSNGVASRTTIRRR